jgi:hypothetical protein
MPNYSKHSKNQELRLKPIEPPLERSLTLTLRSTTTSTRPPMPLLSKLTEMPKPLDLSTSQMHQRLLSLSESEGKFLCPDFGYKGNFKRLL